MLLVNKYILTFTNFRYFLDILYSEPNAANAVGTDGCLNSGCRYYFSFSRRRLLSKYGIVYGKISIYHQL